MKKILCTFPGRHGDLLWALPTIRAISEQFETPVDLQIAGEFVGLVPLLSLQPYLGAVSASASWSAQDRIPPQRPQTATETYTHVYHLGYTRWPELPLPFETYDRALAAGAEIAPLDLARPWITPPPIAQPLAYQRDVVFGFTDCHFELKYGLTELIFPDIDELHMVVNARGIFPPGSRWVTEGKYLPCDWLEAAQWIASAKVFLTDCSALHVLAVALGIPTVVMEPMEARWATIFYPCGYDGPQVTVVKGLDGRPTFDARHVREALDVILEIRHGQS